MAKIQVPADLMMEVARRIRVGKDQLKYILEQNFSRTTALLNEFEGETARRFRSLHEENARTLSLVPVNLQKAADELESIVNKFVDADSGIVHIPDFIGTKSIYDYARDFFKPDFGTIGPAHTSFAPLNELSNARNDSTERPPREEPEKGFGDHVHDFFEGAWKPLSTLDDDIVKLGEQIEEDPVGTIGGMARDAIAAPVEGAVNGATFGWNFLWGTGGAREQVKEYVETEKQKIEEQGRASYAGTAASSLAMHILGRRVGNKRDLGQAHAHSEGQSGIKKDPSQEENEIPKRTYEPSPKHDPKSGWGSPNPIPDTETGQKLLDSAYSSIKSKQLYNIYEGKLIKFQPDGETGWHPYEVANPAKEVPADVLRQLLKDGQITKVEYSKFLKNK
ncbi:WXG100 family type VII secretion target [Paenibacillus sp. P96]|uniref:WXG100 family type VII secretion target n=1 Tax=Paenibacillus zeirhizosphaerae TaxID=2987519 RepID=A0ABT9FRJ1_9BACL|nr:WXG100 family type VII secretion target [Paenibacillus sp. P96]MDP4097353.1 WXG100 family type VII secretion target [Paenibacillus sp. P96]